VIRVYDEAGNLIATRIKTITAGKGVDAPHELVGAATATFSASVAALRDCE
jgi:hypothetical protein